MPFTCSLPATKMEAFGPWPPDLGSRMTSVMVDHFLQHWSQKLFWRAILEPLKTQPTWSSFLRPRKRGCGKPLHNWGKDLTGTWQRSLIWKAFAGLSQRMQRHLQL